MKLFIEGKINISSSNIVIIYPDKPINSSDITLGCSIITNNYDKIQKDVLLGWYRFSNCKVIENNPLTISFSQKEFILVQDKNLIVGDIIDMNF
jgi:hypothetical protein